MALSLNHVLGRRTLALFGVGAATALTSWFIYLRNRYLKQITSGKETEGKSSRQKAHQPTDSSKNGPPDEAPANAANSEDLQMESLSADTSVRLPGASTVKLRHHVTPIEEEEDSTAGAAEVTIDDSSSGGRVMAARPGGFQSAGPGRGGAAAPAPETEIVDSDFEQEIRSQEAAKGSAGADSDLTPEFIANRLAAMSKSDCASVQLLDRDADVLARCLAGSSDGETVRAMQLIGRLAQFQHHMDRLSRGGCLVAEICRVFQRNSGAVEVRLQCLLNLINLSGVPSNQQAILDIAGAIASVVPSSARLAQYGLQLLANLALYEPCRPRLLPLLPGFIAELRLQLAAPPADQSSEQSRRLRQCLTLLSNLTSDSGACLIALATNVEVDELPVPGTANQLLAADPAIRLGWVCFIGNAARETEAMQAATVGGTTLADAFMASLPAMSKLAQKLRDKLRSSDKTTEYGQKVAALAKELKSLLRQSKIKSK
ncbi:hypothetical protein BOX15_Mlig000435g2 [Macrostomum lignano]|uniref:Armadillo repeat-containing domain-containing protein n=2 Tax=Macrostomum lignano TaxID=282301 RepID=A0A267GUA6_9PLAT|nr:hypothetical protein BOX15_Mlig000435g2 [Macrostomum lignano]